MMLLVVDWILMHVVIAVVLLDRMLAMEILVLLSLSPEQLQL